MGPVAVDHTGHRAASVGIQHNDQRLHENPIRVWNLDTGKAIRDLHGHTDWVRALAFGGPDRLVSAAQDGTVRVWDIERGATVAGFGTDDQLVAVATDPTTGTAIVAGHVDNAGGPAVFYTLGALRKGHRIEIDREDGKTAVFTVDAVEVYDNDAFPDEKVYGATDRAELRVITCGGGYSKKGGYDGNVVVFARLSEVRQ